ncbi:MAG: hypothetical protein RL693_861 [Verrucomicrobiota bacterium]|jgi:arylsulfatase A-like enzyme
MKVPSLILVVLLIVCRFSAAADKPNILWFVVDDMSPSFSCYGETTIKTPNVDKLALEGTKFTHAYVTAPVCSACRSALITGMYQTSIGAHNHRSGRGVEKINLPEGVTPIPVLLQKAGYYTCIGSGLPGFDHQDLPVSKDRQGKTDYNFEWDPKIYDSHDWAGRAKDQPFFMQVQLHGGKLRGDSEASIAKLTARAAKEFGNATDPKDVKLPPYYPRDPALLSDWAAYIDSVRFTDKHVGEVIDRLKNESLLENTLIIFMTDHGISHARGKQFLYDEGAHVPFIVRGPGVEKNTVREDLIEQIDMGAISLAAAGIPIPASMQGRDVLAKNYPQRDAVFAARDRCDETIDRIRSVRTDRYLYIRNFYPKRPLLQPNAYKDDKTIVQALRRLHEEGKLDSLTEGLLFSPTRDPEELYEWTTDHWQLKNLAGDPAYRQTLETLRSRLDQWIIDTKDRGPESEKMYDSDMAEYLKKQNPEVEKNIALMKQWAAEGK